jgi:hypothetical protein
MATTALAPFLALCPTNEDLVALLPNLCSGEGSPFVHHADVLSAAPAEVVGNLVPAQGTDKAGDGYGSVWYLLCSKKYKSDAARPYGKRLRSIGGGKECWRAEAGPKKVEVLVDGKPIVGYFRTFSYGYKTPAKQFKRLGWCMVEYSVDGYDDHALCKVYRSPRAKKASSTSNSAVLAPSPASKRKAAGDHPKALPARSGAHQVQETRLSCDAPMMPVQVQHGNHQVHGDDTCPFVIGRELAHVQHSAGPQGLNGYDAQGPQPGAGQVLERIDDSDRFSFDVAAIDFEELLNQLHHDPFASHDAEATWAPPPPDDSFFGFF